MTEQSMRVVMTIWLTLVLGTVTGCGRKPADPVDRLFELTEGSFALLEEFGEGLGQIDSREAADSYAVTLEQDLSPRFRQLTEEMADWAEAMTEPEREALQARLDEPELEQRVQALMTRGERVFARMMENAMRVDERHVTPALETALAAIDRSSEEFDRRMGTIFAGGAQSVGSPAWCRAMADKPQQQWTMNESLAFANHCMGGR